nr:hypothetical protein [Bradyrhizobium sp. JYMT SZCCT0428]
MPPDVAIRRAREGGNRSLDFRCLEGIDRAQLYPKGRRHRLNDSVLTYPRTSGGVANDRDSGHKGRDFFEQIKPFSAQVVIELSETGHIAARPRQALD